MLLLHKSSLLSQLKKNHNKRYIIFKLPRIPKLTDEMPKTSVYQLCISLFFVQFYSILFYYFINSFLQALSKKENKGGGGGSPGGDDSDGDIETNLTPRTEAKYNKIDEEFQIMMQHRNHVNGGSRNLQVRLLKTGSDYMM